MSSWEFMKPLTTKNTNGTLYAPKGSEGVEDLPVVYSNVGIGSEWSCSLWARIKFLFHGRITFMSQGQSHPPVFFVIGTKYFSKE